MLKHAGHLKYGLPDFISADVPDEQCAPVGSSSHKVSRGTG